MTPPIRLVAGCIPDKIVSKQVQFVAVKKIGDKTVVFDEVEAVLEGYEREYYDSLHSQDKQF